MIPKTERVECTYLNDKNEVVAILTQKPMDGNFYLYEVSGKETKKLGKGINPIALEEKYHMKRRMGIPDA